ncbi:putative disease resistance protein At3g14460 [Prosopis cineraria]|nr:putative disease resistance protein At3g14460 [Prosopis cineraria]
MNKFVVAEKGGSKLKELGILDHLTGSRSISNVGCIDETTEVREAKLKEKHLDTLMLQYWRCHEVALHQESIVEALEPNHAIEELTVDGYIGGKFPNWVGGSHLANLVSLYLLRCAKFEQLPLFGQLPSLQKLVIKGFDGIKVIGEEFYGNGSSSAPFCCLSYLSSDEMLDGEE